MDADIKQQFVPTFVDVDRINIPQRNHCSPNGVQWKKTVDVVELRSRQVGTHKFAVEWNTSSVSATQRVTVYWHFGKQFVLKMGMNSRCLITMANMQGWWLAVCTSVRVYCARSWPDSLHARTNSLKFARQDLLAPRLTNIDENERAHSILFSEQLAQSRWSCPNKAMQCPTYSLSTPTATDSLPEFLSWAILNARFLRIERACLHRMKVVAESWMYKSSLLSLFSHAPKTYNLIPRFLTEKYWKNVISISGKI